MMFRLNSFNGCQFTERTRNIIANDQREITPKIYKAELCLFVWVDAKPLLPRSTAEVMSGRPVSLSTLFLGKPP